MMKTIAISDACAKKHAEKLKLRQKQALETIGFQLSNVGPGKPWGRRRAQQLLPFGCGVVAIALVCVRAGVCLVVVGWFCVVEV